MERIGLRGLTELTVKEVRAEEEQRKSRGALLGEPHVLWLWLIRDVQEMKVGGRREWHQSRQAVFEIRLRRVRNPSTWVYEWSSGRKS